MTSISEPDIRSHQSELLRLMIGHWVSNAVGAAAELGIADVLADGDQPIDRIATEVGVGAESLARLLRFLQALGLVERDGSTYALTATGELLRTDHPSSMRNLVNLYQEQYFADAWSELVPALRVGEQPFAKAHGESVFEFLAGRPDALAVYSSGIAVGSAFVAELPHVIDFGGKKVVDVGGGDGTLLEAVLEATPTATGRLIERPAAVAAGERRLAPFVDDHRADVVAGDFFAGLPSGGDVFILCRILHNWDDNASAAILRNVRAAMTTGSSLLIVERVLSDDEPTPVTTAFDLHMFVMTSGRERSVDEYRRLLVATGFELVEVRDLPLEMSVVEARAV